jgi:TonB family protein
MKVGTVATLAMWLALGAVGQSAQETSPEPKSETPSTNKSAASSKIVGRLEVLTNTQGVDFGPYLSGVLDAVRQNWYNFVPAEARAPEMKSGKVSIEFVILRDGHVAAMKVTEQSGDTGMDRAAWGGITASIPFAPLPEQFKGPYLALRFHFFYNPPKSQSGALQPQTTPEPAQSAPK